MQVNRTKMYPFLLYRLSDRQARTVTLWILNHRGFCERYGYPARHQILGVSIGSFGDPWAV